MKDKRIRNEFEITGWDILGSFGIGKDSLKESLNGVQVDFKKIDNTRLDGVPKGAALSIPGFEIKSQIGTKGTRNIDRHNALAIKAIEMAIRDSGTDVCPDNKEKGLVIATSTGSIKSITDFTRDSMVEELPFYVNPAHFPNTVLNCAAGQSAIWHQLKGPNVTLSGGHASFYSALAYTIRTINTGYTKTVIVGAVEEVSEQTAWAYHKLASEPGRKKRPLSESCAMFLIRRIDGDGNVREASEAPKLRAVCVGFDCRNPQDALTECIERVLSFADVDGQEVSFICRRDSGNKETAEAEKNGIRVALNGRNTSEELALEDTFGETFSSLGAVQLAVILSKLINGQHTFALATILSSNGTVGCMLVEGGGK